MNELINVKNENGELLVSARELHKGLEISERFSNWFKRMLQYGFEENIDYIGCKVFNALAKQELQDYILKLDTAKEICMIQRNDKGKQFRKYFIECEKKLKDMSIPSYQIEDSIARAERWICEEKERQRLSIENTKLIEENKGLKDEIEELEEYKKIKEMVNNTNDELMLLGKLGQYLKSNTTLKTGQKLIFKFCKENGLVKHEYKENHATARAVNNGYLKNVCEYALTKRGMMPVNKIYVSKKGILYISKKLFEQQLKEQLDK